MTDSKDAPRLRKLMEALAEHEAGLTDAQILEDAVAAGVDVKAEAERVRSVLLGGIRKEKRARLDRAEEEHKREVARITGASARLPRTPQERRARLQRAIDRAPQLRLTMQNRGLESISDDDVESALRQLAHLGLLDDEPDEP
jgi:hypothetical protein